MTVSILIIGLVFSRWKNQGYLLYVLITLFDFIILEILVF